MLVVAAAVDGEAFECAGSRVWWRRPNRRRVHIVRGAAMLTEPLEAPAAMLIVAGWKVR